MTYWGNADRARQRWRAPGWLSLVVTVFTFLGASAAMAQVPPASTVPGGVEQEQQRQQRRLEQQTQTPKHLGPAGIAPGRGPADLLKPGGPKFRLREVRFDGTSKFLSKEELDAVLAPYVGHNVDFSDLQKLVAAINALYAEKGLVTGIATMPPQSVGGGDELI